MRITTADILDDLCLAVDVAREKVAHNPRWLQAVDTAWGWLLQVDAVAYDPTTRTLTVASATTAGVTYHANGACQCRAFRRGNACWHRAAARLVTIALDMAMERRAARLAALIAQRRRERQRAA